MLYIAVTPDKFELPMAVAGSQRELAEMLGITEQGVRNRLHAQSIGRVKKGRNFRIVSVEEVAE